jgi:hypothetical protein
MRCCSQCSSVLRTTMAYLMGWLEVGMSMCLGYVPGRAMLESEGLLWPWLIHFLQDMVIFSSLAIGAVTSGGR